MISFFRRLSLLAVVFSIFTSSTYAYSYYKTEKRPNYTARLQQQYRESNNYRTPYQYTPRNNYDSYNQPITNSCSNLSFVSVGVGTLANGVNISVASQDPSLVKCIKEISWLSYFTRFGNSVRVDISHTTLGVQILATSYDMNVVSHLQNTGWKNLITGNVNTYNTYAYSSYNTYDNSPYSYNHGQNTSSTFYTPVYNISIPTRNNNDRYYRSGREVLGSTSQIARSISYITNGIQMSFTSPDYNTMQFLQRFSFTNTFSHLSGISITQINIGGGVQVTVTSGSTSTITEIQNIGYYIVYQ